MANHVLACCTSWWALCSIITCAAGASFGKAVFNELHGWAKEFGHKTLYIHFLHTRPEYRFLRKRSRAVYKSELFGDVAFNLVVSHVGPNAEAHNRVNRPGIDRKTIVEGRQVNPGVAVILFKIVRVVVDAQVHVYLVAKQVDSIVDEILACEATKKNFRITKQELRFYKKFRIPIPKLHPDERHRRRMALRTPRHLWKRYLIGHPLFLFRVLRQRLGGG